MDWTIWTWIKMDENEKSGYNEDGPWTNIFCLIIASTSPKLCEFFNCKSKLHTMAAMKVKRSI